MNRLRTDSYNDLPMESDAAIADKDGLALDFIWIDDTPPSDQLFGHAATSFGIKVAACWRDGLLPAAGDRPIEQPKDFF
jgi:hypothetical protein